MTYNMLTAPGPRLQVLTGVVRDLGPDILALQEITDLAGLLAMSAALGMFPVIGFANGPETMHPDPAGPVPADPGRTDLEHVAVLTRFPVVRTEVHHGDPTVAFRPVLEVQVAVPGLGPIEILAVHLRAFAGPEGDHVKMREVQSLVGRLRSPSRLPLTCVMGDMNAWMPGEGERTDAHRQAPADHMADIEGAVLDAIRRCGVEDAWRLVAASPREVPGTVLSTGGWSPVDHILLTPGLAARVVHVEVPDGPALREASDHLPVLVDLAW